MSSETINLRGIAWNHTRGFLPVVATAQRFEELNPEISIRWEKRSLQAFADCSMVELANNFDLIVMDHPHIALAAAQELLLPLDDWLSSEFLADQATNSVGTSFESYNFASKQWSIAIDAAAPISTRRLDLFDRYGLAPPQSWNDVLALASHGHVTVAAFPIDILMHTYMFCAALGGEPFAHEDCLAPHEVVSTAIMELRRLVSLCDPHCCKRNPIRTAEWMASTDDRRAAYCPFAYGYSNYSRSGYSKYPLKAGGIVTFGGRRLRSTIGGAGIAISSRTKHPRACMNYSQFCASPDVQKGIYFQSGGQPGHRMAWTDDAVNAASSDFFRDTLQTLDEAIVRGKFPGYMRFQDEATPIVHRCVSRITEPTDAAQEVNRLYSKCYAG